jgi:hydroxyacylglutathione hydrolase
MQVTPAIHALRHPFRIPVAPGIDIDRFVYSYLIFGETITLIDTGVAGCETAIFDYIRSAGRSRSEITLIILTHSHPDHLGAARAIQQVTGCTIMAHGSERSWIEDVELQNRQRPVPGFAALVGGNVQLDHTLTDGDAIDPDGTRVYELQVFHTPGHSAGSISIFLQSEGALFCGDAVPVEGDLPVYDDARESIRSLKKLRAIRGVRILLSSWDDPREHEAAYRQIDRAPAYLQKIHDTVVALSDSGLSDPMEIAGKTAAALELPPNVVTPIFARTIAANLRAVDHRNLLTGD